MKGSVAQVQDRSELVAIVEGPVVEAGVKVYVLSKNLHRRHLTVSQRSMIGDKARAYYDAEAKKRQQDNANRRNQPENAKVETLPPMEKAKARDQAGKAVGVSGKSIDKARKVREKMAEYQAISERRKIGSTGFALEEIRRQ